MRKNSLKRICPLAKDITAPIGRFRELRESEIPEALAGKSSALTISESAFYYDSATALVRDGEIVTAPQEDGFGRRKLVPGFAANANILLPVGGWDPFGEAPLYTGQRLFWLQAGSIRSD